MHTCMYTFIIHEHVYVYVYVYVYVCIYIYIVIQKRIHVQFEASVIANILVSCS